VGGTGRRGFAVARVKQVELGDSEIGSVNFAAFPLSDWGLAASDAALAEVEGILGGPELAAWNSIVDCRSLRLWFKQPATRR